MSTGSTEPGTLAVVGLGMQPGRHIGERALSEIRRADVVFAIAGELFLEWLRGMHPDVRDLRTHYADDRDRRDTYRRMQDELLEATLAGRRVVAALYGHPGVFADVGHAAIAEARARGAHAWMEPGVSAEACLYADLGLDPGASGVQSFEATQFLVQQRDLDAASLVLLWQVALAGNVDCTGFVPDHRRLEVLVDKLSRWYPRDSRVLLYEAASLSVQDFRADPIRLDALPTATLSTATTLVIPPARSPDHDHETRTRLASIR
ncbi:MAG: SAM-dependent methyltransferase [Candidatus Wenzhouxiangella sp. M2_3B_020]